MLDLLTTADAAVTLPLGCDPAMARANPASIVDGHLDAPLLRYTATLDWEPLVIPPDAMLATVRPADEVSKREAQREAGRPTFCGQQVYQRVMGEIAEGADMAVTLDALTSDDAALYEAHSAWVRRWHLAIIRRCCVSLQTPSGTVEGTELARSLERRTTPLGEAVIRDVAGLCLRVAALGKAMPRSCATSSGAPGSTPGSGSAAAATDDLNQVSAAAAS